MTAAKKEDVLLPQDAKAVDPSQLSALTPEVVSCFLVADKYPWLLVDLTTPPFWIMPEGAWNGLWGHHMRWRGEGWHDVEVPDDGGFNDG